MKTTTKTRVGASNWQRDIAVLGLTRITEDRECALVVMAPGGDLSVLDKTYRDRRVAVGQATRIENESSRSHGGFLRVYVVTKFGTKAAVYLDANTLLWHGEAA